jgi:oxygen-independent coproporphyrinogen-3 oxidase
MPAGVYLHIPFCKSRCSYCDFATDVYRSSDAVERYVEALCMEISVFSSPEKRTTLSGITPSDEAAATIPQTRRGPLPNPKSKIQNPKLVDTIYFGGGTPSLLSPEQVGTILTTVREKFEIAEDVEITMEMNPATVTRETLAGYRSLGVNRASFGVQTFDDRELKLLARGHDANDARTTFTLLRDAGFENISFDLIAGLPGQTIEGWKRNLDESVSMRPEHMSLYLLEIHEGTPLAEQLRSGRRPPADEEIAAEMYELMLDSLAAAAYEQYEISNFARPGFESRHNSKYWRLDPVYGFGVSAHSFDGAQRYANERDTAKYVESIESNDGAEVFREPIDAASEFIFLGLRFTLGIDLEEYRRRFGIDLETKYANELASCSVNGLTEVNGGRFRLTRRGMLFSNEVFSLFV